MFLKLKYPEKRIDSIFKRFYASQDQTQNRIELVDSPVRIILPFKVGCLADWLIGLLAGWLTDWLIDWPTDWLTDHFLAFFH